MHKWKQPNFFQLHIALAQTHLEFSGLAIDQTQAEHRSTERKVKPSLVEHHLSCILWGFCGRFLFSSISDATRVISISVTQHVQPVVGRSWLHQGQVSWQVFAPLRHL